MWPCCSRSHCRHCEHIGQPRPSTFRELRTAATPGHSAGVVGTVLPVPGYTPAGMPMPPLGKSLGLVVAYPPFAMGAWLVSGMTVPLMGGYPYMGSVLLSAQWQPGQ